MRVKTINDKVIKGYVYFKSDVVKEFFGKGICLEMCSRDSLKSFLSGEDFSVLLQKNGALLVRLFLKEALQPGKGWAIDDIGNELTKVRSDINTVKNRLVYLTGQENKELDLKKWTIITKN